MRGSILFCVSLDLHEKSQPQRWQQIEHSQLAAGQSLELMFDIEGFAFLFISLLKLQPLLSDLRDEVIRLINATAIFGTILLTQGYAKQMARRRRGRILIVSSIHGIAADPLVGPYCASKHALEAFGEALAKEMQEFAVQVQMINPGPYLTGFNELEFESWKDWQDDPEGRIFDYSKFAFPYPQFAPEGAIKEMLAIISGKRDKFRNIVPRSMSVVAKKMQKGPWKRSADKDLFIIDSTIMRSKEMEPATKPGEAVIDKLKDIFSKR